MIASTSSYATGLGLGTILAMLRGDEALTRTQIVQRTGLSRSTVNQRLEALLGADLVRTAGDTVPARGRPAETFTFNSARGILLVCDIGATGMRAALCDLAGTVVAEEFHTCDVTQGPEAVLSVTSELFDRLLDEQDHNVEEVEGVALSVPGPVDFESAQVVSPPIMTGWDRYDIRGWFSHTYEGPVLVDKDANAMAWGEYQRAHADTPNMLMVKLGTGVGSGIIANGEIFRGADGAAGDIGHTQASGTEGGHACRCGNVGCVEADAGGWAMIRDLHDLGHDVEDVDGVVSLIRSGDPDAVQLARSAGRTLGTALSEAVNLLNPRVVVLGGQLARADEQILAGIREMIYKWSLPLATRKLRIEASRLDPHAGVAGLALLLTDQVLAPARIDRLAAGPRARSTR